MHCLRCELTHHFDHSFFPANKSELEEQAKALNLSKEGLDHIKNLEPDDRYYYKSVQEVLGFPSLASFWEDKEKSLRRSVQV